MLQKEYVLKMYDQDGTTLLDVIEPNKLMENPRFHSTINGGLGELRLPLNLQWDNFGEGTTIDFMNIVDVYAHDANNPRGRRIYRGFLSDYKPFIEPDGQGVEIIAQGLFSLLSFSYYGSSPSYVVSHSLQDPETIAKAIIDNFNTAFGGSLIGYGGGNTTAVGTTVSKTFTEQKWADALKEDITMAGTDWWTKIDANGELHFSPKPSSATHTFIIGKHVDRIEVTKSMREVINEAIVKYASGTVTATDSASQAEFGLGGGTPTGRMSKIESNSGNDNAAAAQQKADKLVADEKDGRIQVEATINNEYDLESIEVGHTCKFRNYNKSSNIFSDNMLIVGLQYSSDTVEIELEKHPANFVIEMSKLV